MRFELMSIWIEWVEQKADAFIYMLTETKLMQLQETFSIKMCHSVQVWNEIDEQTLNPVEMRVNRHWNELIDTECSLRFISW